MVNELISYIGSMHHTVKKEDVVKSNTNVFNNIHNDVIPMLDQVIANSDLIKIKDSKIVKTLINTTKLKARTSKEFFIKLKAMFVNIDKQHKTMETLLDKDLNTFITNNAAQGRDVTILKVVQDLGAMSQYVMDLSYYILAIGQETDFPKNKFKTVQADIGEFGIMVKIYSTNFDKMLKDINKVSTNIVHINDGKVSMLEKLFSTSGKTVSLPMASNFINNPIYHIRMWLVDDEIDKYESLKDKKRLIELKLMELKLDESGEHDSKLTSQIAYYENKLSKMEYDIQDIEDN